ncbi:glycine betaine ABC transporter substrate-binding protein [Beijerinckia sp. L45]|uniref:glycine betaine ABC transporter substrate-binding protein n=1 Tax=Beijerinckia sp. L45 TaxID=1641855 RepID=UPI00131E2AD0|nr:glycine betaine ABC transporter substrate-binding protein [Beijerinckia sp. L45]
MIFAPSRRAFIATGAALVLGATARADDAPVVVGSKLDVEGGIIGAMILQTLAAAGIPTVNRLLLGPTAILRQAILASAVDLYPEYTGNAAFFFNRDGEAVWKDAAAGYRLAADLDKAKNDLIWLPPAPADNTWVIAVPGAVAAAHGLKTLVDFARWVGQGGVKLAASAEFVESAAGLPAFESTYGFRLTATALLVLSGGDTSATIKAAASAISGVNAAMAYSTDGALAALGLIALVDDRHAQPVYAPAAVVRGPVLDRRPAIAGLLRPVFAGLDLPTLRRLNERVAVEGEDASLVAADYLKSHSNG